MNLPRPLENVKEPKREDFATEEAFQLVYDEYKIAKDEYDFWSQFEIRELIISQNEDEIILASDECALEKRITANRSHDENLVRMIKENIDPHGMTATFIFGDNELKGIEPNKVKKVRPDLRNIGKTMGFAMDYGGTEYTVSKKLGIDKETARKYIDKYWEGFKGQAENNMRELKLARKNGYVLTMFGHKRHLPDINSDKGFIRSQQERFCANSPVQGTGADVISIAQNKISNDPVLKALGYRMIIQIYDEVVSIGPKKYYRIAAERIVYHMSHVLDTLGDQIVVPLNADWDIGMDYAAAK